MYYVKVERQIAKPIDEVFTLLVDHANYAQYPGVVSSTLLEPGSHEINGEGALRYIDAGKIQLTERIIGFDRPHRMAYHIESSKPFFIELEKGEVSLSQQGELTHVTWISQGRIKVPLIGPLLDKLLTNQFARGFGAILKAIDKR